MFELDYPNGTQPPDETDNYTLRVIEGIRKLQELAPQIKECKSTKEVNNIRTNCQLIQTYAMSRKLDRELVLWAQRCNLMCVRRIGEILVEMKEKGERRKPGHSHGTKVLIVGEQNTGVLANTSKIPSLAELNISKMDSSDGQALASISEEELTTITEKHIKETGQIGIQAISHKIQKRKSNKPDIIIHKPRLDNFSAYWKEERKLLDKYFNVETLVMAGDAWSKHFAEYLEERKAKLEKQKAAFGK